MGCFKKYLQDNFQFSEEEWDAIKPSDKNLKALTDCALINITRTNMDKLFKACPRYIKIMGLIDHKVMMNLMTQRDFLLHADAEENRYAHWVADI